MKKTPARNARSYAPRGSDEEARSGELNPEYQQIWESRAGGLLKILRSEQYADDDDPDFWRVAITEIVGESLAYYHECRVKDPILIRVGRCSHWIRPHAGRYKVAGGFAGPYGYTNTGQGFALGTPPHLEWSFTWTWDSERGDWKGVRGRPGRRPLMFRISLPSRTARHNQAAVHAMWDPGTPADPKTKSLQLYFFRKYENGWARVGDWIDEPEVGRDIDG